MFSSKGLRTATSQEKKRRRDNGGPESGRRGLEKTTSSTNPFDVVNNAKARHTVVNRRVKGANRNVAKARASAFERRSKSLLIEHRNRHSANNFVDRRFGEGDLSMSVEERMYERFKRERQKRAKSSAYSLQDNELTGSASFDALTHGGQPLADRNYGASGDAGGFSDGSLHSDDDDEINRRGQIDSDYVNEMHFGGGLSLKNAGENEGVRSKKDVLEEMIARSKDQKRERQQRKDLQESTLDKMDSEFDELVGLLDFRGKNQPKPELDAFEKDVRAMNFETRSKPTDRKKTDEELAAEELSKMQKLERRRLRRMNSIIEPDSGSNASSSSDEDDEDAKQGKESESGNRKKKRNGRTSGNSNSKIIELTPEQVAEGYTVDTRTGIIMPPSMFDDEEGKDSDSGSGDDNDDESEDEDDCRFDESDEDKELTANALDSGDRNESKGSCDEYHKMDLKDCDTSVKEQKKKSSRELSTQMPYLIDPPRNAMALHELIHRYTKSPADVAELIRRIRVTSPVALDPTGRNRLHMHNLYDALLRRMVMIGDDSNNPESEHLYILDSDTTHKVSESKLLGVKSQISTQLDDLCVTLYQMTQELGGDTVCALWRRYLMEIQCRVMKRLREDAAYSANESNGEEQFTDLQLTTSSASLAVPTDSSQVQWQRKKLRTARTLFTRIFTRPSCWPSLGELLLLRQLAHIFPTSDLRHPVTTPALLLLGQTLAQCPVHTPDDLVSGILASATLLHYTTGFQGGAKRIAPESLAFLRSVLLLFSLSAASNVDEVLTSELKECKASTVSVDLRTTADAIKSAPMSLSERHHIFLLPTFTAAVPLGLWMSGSMPFASASVVTDTRSDDRDNEGRVIVPTLSLSQSAPKLPPQSVIQLLNDLVEGKDHHTFAGQNSMKVSHALLEAVNSSGKKDKTEDVFSMEELQATGDFAVSCLGAALRLIILAAKAYHKSAAFYELFEPIGVALVELGVCFRAEEISETNESGSKNKKHKRRGAAAREGNTKGVRPIVTKCALGSLYIEARSTVDLGVEHCLRHRVPMQWRSVTKADTAVKALAPKFEARFDGASKKFARDDEKALMKALKREQKGASRELRRDAEYLSKTRDDERNQRTMERKDDRHRNFAWLESQQATLNQQVRKGKGLAGGGSSIKKSASAVLKSGRRQK